MIIIFLMTNFKLVVGEMTKYNNMKEKDSKKSYDYKVCNFRRRKKRYNRTGKKGFSKSIAITCNITCKAERVIPSAPPLY